MPLSRRSLLACFSGAVLSSLSVPLSAQTPAPAASSPAGSESRAVRIAFLMPPDDSPFLSAARIVANGLASANRLSAAPAEIFLIESSVHASVQEALDTAVISSADILVGPIERSAVEALARMPSLPLPVLALNTPSQLSACPNELAMLSIGTDHEAEWIARLAIEALPAPEALTVPRKVAVITGTAPWEERIRDVYSQVLIAAGIDYEIITFNPEGLDDLQKRFEPELSSADAAAFSAELRKALASAQTEAARKAATKRVHAQRRARVTESEPPFQAVLFALSAQEAALVRNRLPRGTRIWATSACSPGNPAASSTAATLAYDLDGLVFTECPAVVRYDSASFEARFRAPMPYSPSAKRLFALGADACEAAARWSQHQTAFQIDGETGALSFSRDQSPLIDRTPRAVAVQNGALIEIPRETAVMPALPQLDPSAVPGTDGQSAAPAQPEAGAEAAEQPAAAAPEQTQPLPPVSAAEAPADDYSVRTVVVEDPSANPAAAP